MMTCEMLGPALALAAKASEACSSVGVLRTRAGEARNHNRMQGNTFNSWSPFSLLGFLVLGSRGLACKVNRHYA